MATYKIENIVALNGTTTFDVTWTKADSTVIGPHKHEIHSILESEIYEQLDAAAAKLEADSVVETVPTLVTGKDLTPGVETAKAKAVEAAEV